MVRSRENLIEKQNDEGPFFPFFHMALTNGLQFCGKEFVLLRKPRGSLKARFL